MEPDTHNLAIETSSRHGSVTLGRGETPVETLDLPEQRRHAIELMPSIDALCQRHGVTPAAVGCVFVSLGPGSFTGLRIGVTTAKVLAWTHGARLVGVPTLDAVVANAPADRPHVAVLLNAKKGRCYTGLYERRDDRWETRFEPALLTPDELLNRAPRPLAIIGDKLPDFDRPADVEWLDPALAIPRSEAVWRLGLERAAAGLDADPAQLTPLYVRLPEPEEKWRARQAASER